MYTTETSGKELNLGKIKASNRIKEFYNWCLCSVLLAEHNPFDS